MPMVIGHVTENSARVWVRGHARRTSLDVRATSSSGHEHVRQAELSADDGYTAVLDFDGLEPDTLYRLTCEELTGSFRTFPNQDSAFQFMLNSCNFHGWGSIRSHHPACRRRTELAQDCRFTLHVGDQLYADQPWPSLTLEDFRQAYQRAWLQPDTRALFANCPNYMVADDHEVLDGFSWDGSFSLLQRLLIALRGNFRPAGELYQEVGSHGMRAFDEFQSSHGPRTYEPARYFSFRYGEHHFFALDLRFERQRRQGRMISEAQREAFFAWLSEHRHQPKFVITSTPFVVEKVKAGEKWCGPEFSHQRHKIIDFLAAEKLSNLVFLSGDIHASCHAEMDIEDGRGGFFTLHELCASPLNGTLQRGLRSFRQASRRVTEAGTSYRSHLDPDSFLGRPRWGGTSNSALMLVKVNGNEIAWELHRTRVRETAPARSGQFHLADSPSTCRT